jgi:hypothetical protein
MTQPKQVSISLNHHVERFSGPDAERPALQREEILNIQGGGFMDTVFGCFEILRHRDGVVGYVL